MNDIAFYIDDMLFHIVRTPLFVLFAVVIAITVLTCIFAAKELKRKDITAEAAENNIETEVKENNDD